ncbi:hypothetical protein D9757_009987 [Collybiopsis confluens]|uniref:F-box domain-containing protein n=1 Tax=Collybiopsis confluens TaxID=2823264 RepID=A0A8H5GUR6_9AGAR|nr:hypothetical protein D9757_009987 [Collybiopsis confluens]
MAYDICQHKFSPTALNLHFLTCTMLTWKETITNLDKLVAEVNGAEDSEYTQLLERNRTNAIPESANERLQMNLSVDEAARELERCDQVISELEEQLARLKEWRNHLIRTRIAPKKSLLSPIRKLPPEVLRSIFAHVKSRILVSGANSGKLRSPVFGLTWVCAHWRAVALSESQMWNDYEVDWRSSQYFDPKFIAFMRECFEVRAQHSPIDLALLGNTTTTPSTIHIVLDIVFQSPERWGDVKFDFSWSRPSLEYLAECLRIAGTTSFPHLKSFTIRVSDAAELWENEVLRTLQDCPRLRDLQSSFLDPAVACDMKHLTSLKLDCFIGHSLTQLLMQCPLLESLSLQNFSSAPIPNTVYHHLHLAHLEVYIVDWGFEVGWGTGLHLPALTHLSLFPLMRDEGRFEALHEMTRLLIRSNCSLNKIQLGFYWVAEEEKSRFLDDISPVIAPGTLIAFS